MTHAVRPSSHYAAEGRCASARRIRLHTTWCVLVLALGCRSSGGTASPAGPPVPAIEPRRVDSAIVATPPIAFGFAPGRQQYAYNAMSEIIAATVRGDTVRDSLSSSAVIVADFRDSGDRVTVSGRVDSLRTRSRRRGGPAMLAVTAVTFSLAIDRASSHRAIARDSTAVCTPNATAQDIGASVVWRIPAAIRAGVHWGDSLQRMTCVGNTPASVTSVADYVLLDRSASLPGDTADRIIRLTRSLLRSARSAADTAFSAGGTMTSNDTLHIELGTGRIIRIAGTSHGRFDVTHTTQIETFDQLAAYQINRIGQTRR